MTEQMLSMSFNIFDAIHWFISYHRHGDPGSCVLEALPTGQSDLAFNFSIDSCQVDVNTALLGPQKPSQKRFRFGEALLKSPSRILLR
ncbi:hypothetical protein CYR75_04415 [Paracoccus jeotgali]|uniref:Uncharacterized protein n=1 Tax=Paracoccus jeotgali TaxID=2065379 RepID=A0A2K9MDB1_9RHOB|nr:hypothetical protein CYR75_04415 [Paracoccus jeotgali]